MEHGIDDVGLILAEAEGLKGYHHSGVNLPGYKKVWTLPVLIASDFILTSYIDAIYISLPSYPMAQELYAPEKYQVIEGSATGVALCTCWSDPRTLVSEHPELKAHFTLIGSLYSVGGISVMLRNLALIQSLHTIILWPRDELSQTSIGRRGWEALERVWDGAYWHLLDDEIDRETIRELTSSVRLVQGGGMSVPELVDDAKNRALQGDACQRPVIHIPPPAQTSARTYPSEGIGFTFRGEGIRESWEALISGISRYGTIKGSEYGSRQRELKCVTWVVENASLRDALANSHTLGYASSALEEYAGQFLTSSCATGLSYTYGQRLRDHHGHDQVVSMINRIRSNADTRRAFATTLVPSKDSTSELPPCLTQVQALADDALHLMATFRSQDCYKAGIPNAVALLGLLEHIASESGLSPGSLSITVASAHIYEEDWRRVPVEISRQGSFRPDPRGNVHISIEGEQITACLRDMDGRVLVSHSGVDPESIAMRFACDNLLSDPSHYCYLAFELNRAKRALREGLSYIQDRPLSSSIL